MRILALGVPLPGPQIDNYTFASAPSFFDYDALVVDPAALSQLIEQLIDSAAAYATHFDQPVANAATSPLAIGLADLLRRRQDETARLLARGGVVVCLAYPDVVHTRVVGFTGCDRYFWLPAPPGMQYREPHLLPADGSEAFPTDLDHPFAPYIQAYRRNIAYRAYISEAVEGFSGFGKVFARSAGGAALGVELAAAGGRVVFIPPPRRVRSGDERYAFSNTLQEAIRHTLGRAAEGPAPSWIDEYPLPGLSDLQAERAEAGRRLTETQAELTQADSRLAEVDKYRRLLWQEGKYGLDAPVREALALLGFSLPQDPDVPAELRFEGRKAFLEVEGSESTVGMEAHHRLRRRLEEAIKETGQPQRGVLVVNGHRRLSPAQRPPQYDDSLRVAAESMRYCLVTADQLFQAVRATMEGDEETVKAFRDRLLTGEGALRTDPALG